MPMSSSMKTMSANANSTRPGRARARLDGRRSAAAARRPPRHGVTVTVRVRVAEPPEVRDDERDRVRALRLVDVGRVLERGRRGRAAAVAEVPRPGQRALGVVVDRSVNWKSVFFFLPLVGEIEKSAYGGKHTGVGDGVGRRRGRRRRASAADPASADGSGVGVGAGVGAGVGVGVGGRRRRARGLAPIDRADGDLRRRRWSRSASGRRRTRRSAA